jgi:tetratricopeptide (TPR) repeat protein
MAVLTLNAVAARREAERQRAEAEGQIEFMLTDLRNRLRGIGSIAVMQAVNERAFAYYGRQGELSDMSADSLLRRARVLKAIGEDELTNGRFDSAFAAFDEARRTTAEQLARAPGDPERRFEHARSEYWIGRVHELRGEWEPAQRQYDLFGETMTRLLAMAPDNPTYLTEAGWGEINRGNIHLGGTGDYATAQRAYERAIGWFERTRRLQPADRDARRVLANAYGYLGDSFFMRSMWLQSLAARQRQYDLVAQLQREAPERADYVYRLALAQRGIARSLDKVGQRTRARQELFRAFGWSRWLSERDPGNAEWRLFRAMVDCDLLFLGLGEPPGQTRVMLRGDFHDVATALAAENNPRVSELARCSAAMRREGVTQAERGDRR